MKNLLTLFFLLFISVNTIYSQEKNTDFKFDTKYFDAVNQWVVFPKNQESDSYIYGYIYIDETASFTFHMIDSFKIINEALIAENTINPKVTMVKTRLSNKTNLVYILSESQRIELKLPEVPTWLDVYKGADDDVEYLKNIGFHFNHVGASQNALEPLLKAYAILPHHEGLEFELGFAYNALQQYDKAIPVLEKATENDDKDQLLYKELGFAYLNSEQFDKAEITYIKGIEISKDDAIKCEMALNMSNAYFVLKNKEKFKKWAEITRKYSSKTPQYLKYIEYFEKELEKN